MQAKTKEYSDGGNSEPSVDKGTVVVRNYGLLAPLDWNDDVTAELRRMNRLWNALVEIDRYAREQYWVIINASEAMGGIGQEIAALEAKREALFMDRRSRFAKERGKAGVDTSDIEEQIKEVKATLSPLYAERKKRHAAAKAECKAAIDANEAERREFVKLARQHSGLYWGNYNAVIGSYDVARIRAMKEGVMLRFHAYDGTGRFVNQIQGGMTVQDLFNGKHSQVSIKPLHGETGNAKHLLTVTAFTGRDADKRHYRRQLSFPVVLHRGFPDDAVIKEVSVLIGRDPQGRPSYQATFTCRSVNPGETASGTKAVGINLGWKQVKGGLRVATVAAGKDEIEHLLLPQKWIDGMAYADSLQTKLDEGLNGILPEIKNALAGLPRPDAGISVEHMPEGWHRRLYGLSIAPKYGITRLLGLAFDMKLLWQVEPTAIPLLHDLAPRIENWRKDAKRTFIEMSHLRDRLRGQRKDMYRTFAKKVVDRAGLIAIDATSYKDAAMLRDPQTDEKTKLYPGARANRVLVAPYELRLSLEQAAKKRNARIERYAGKINLCGSCGGRLDGKPDEVQRLCGECGAQWDVDENAALNLLAAALAEPPASA